METMMHLQAQMKAQAEEQSDALSAVRDWMDEIKEKDAKLRGATALPASSARAGPAVAGKARTAAAEPRVESRAGDGGQAPTAGTAADHTYDKGYRKWERFDVDAALEESDGGRRLSSTAAPRAGVVSKGSSGTRAEPLTEPVRQRNVVDEMREAGNAAMRTGDYAAAVQHYDRQLQLDPSSYIGYSNRAQAHLGLKDYRLAAQDATSALRLDPTHVKSWVRRATARNHLGMHTLALADLQAALALDPSNKTVLQDLRKTQEHTRAAKRRLPELVLPVGSAT